MQICIETDPLDATDCSPEGWSRLLVWPMLCHLFLWAVPYYAIVFVVKAGEIKANNYTTLYTYTMKTNPVTRSFVKPFPEALRPFAYLLQHFLFSSCTFAFTILLWRYFWLHTGFLTLLILRSAWNGATFIFEAMTRKYESNIRSEAINRVTKKGE